MNIECLCSGCTFFAEQNKNMIVLRCFSCGKPIFFANASKQKSDSNDN